MTGRKRPALVLSGRVAVNVGRRTRVCPVCHAAIGWRCTKTVAGAEVPRKTDHRERNART